MKKSIEIKLEPTNLQSIISSFGLLITLSDLAEIYNYGTVDAVRKAHFRGTLPVPLYRFPNKSGFYAKPKDVARSLENMTRSPSIQNSKVKDI